MIRKCLLMGVVGVVLAGMVATTLAAPKEKGAGLAAGRGRKGQVGVRLGIQTYTWHQLTFFECIDKSKEAGIKFVEGFAWQKLSPDMGETKLNPEASAEAIKKTQEKLKEAGLQLVNLYVADFGKDEAAMKKYFEFAKTMGIHTFVSEPDAKTLDALEPLCKEYKVRIAIHNHPKGDANYTNWKPENVMESIAKRSKAIGTCADTGHWIRAGLDPVECLKKYEGRLICLHLKDVNEKGTAGEDVPFGTGVGNVKGQLEELARQKFNGMASIEYESKKADNMADVKQCVEYFNKTTQELGIKTAAR